MEIETPVLLAYAIEDSTDIFRISGVGGFEHPKPPLSVRHCSKPHMICSANKHNTVCALRNNVAGITANYNKLSPQSQRQYHTANVNIYELQIAPYYITK